MKNTETSLQAILDQTADGKKIFGTSFALKTTDLEWEGAAGNLQPGQPYFIASTTKLFTTAIVMQLRDAGRLRPEDRISDYLEPDLLSGLHVYKGREYSGEITIHHLLAHTSGLPDYFQGKGAQGKSLEDELVAGADQGWSLKQVLERSRTMQPLFKPGTPGRAHYSDVNFQLLGKIIENISGQSYAGMTNEKVIQPLGLHQTYLYQDAGDQRPAPLYYRQHPLNIPKAMTSFGPDGGMVSTSADMLRFIQAFFTGQLFPAHYLEGMQQWNKIFFPMQSGVGIHLFKLPWYFNPTGAVPPFMGHSGLSGALAYYCPSKNLFIAGTVNQVAHPDLSFRTMIKLALQATKKK